MRILGVPEEGEVAVVGTLYKEMGLKPSILDEYTKDRALSQQLGRARFTQPDDRCAGRRAEGTWWGGHGCSAREHWERCRCS